MNQGGSGGTSLYQGSGAGTYYYDVTGRTCNGAPRYAENDGYPTCTSFNPQYWKTLQQYGTNNIVAIDRHLLATDAGRQRYCGKEIKVFRNGVEVSSPNGQPFVVFDGCEACEGRRINFSISALDKLTMAMHAATVLSRESNGESLTSKCGHSLPRLL